MRYKQKKRATMRSKAYQAAAASPSKVGPSLPLGQRTRAPIAIPGTAISRSASINGALTIDFKSTPRMSGALEHWQYDSFVTRLDDSTIEPAYVTFGLDADGKVERVTMKAGLAACGFQLRLCGSAVRAGRHFALAPVCAANLFKAGLVAPQRCAGRMSAMHGARRW